MGRIQEGAVYEASGVFYVRYCATEIVDGQPKRVQRSARLCEKDSTHELKRVAVKGRKHKKTYLSPALQLKRDEFMLKINSQQNNTRAAQPQADMAIADFWELHFLPYCETVLPLTGQPRKRASTVRGYKQIWRQHLQAHFGTMKLQEYEPDMGALFLQGLTSTQGKTTIKHIKALGSAIFKRAVIAKRIKVNPWHDVEIPEDAVEPASTEHYTMAEAEDMISALVDHVDCQLILALACFLGLRPGEIAALRWEDFDADELHIRRSVVRGVVGQPKTLESVATIPVIAQVRIPLELYRQKCDSPKEGWLFEGRTNQPVASLHNIISRVILPHVNGDRECERCHKTPEASPVRWKTLYAGRRGAATNTIETTGGNYAVAQALLRHKHMTTTLNVYKKQITPASFREGMKLLEAAAGKK